MTGEKLEIPHDVLMELLKTTYALLGVLAAGFVTLRYKFRKDIQVVKAGGDKRLEIEKAKAKWTDEAITRFEQAIARLEGDAKDHRIVTNHNTVACEGLKARVETLQPQVDRLMETMPVMIDLLGKVSTFFERKTGSKSNVKEIAPEVTRVEEKKEKKS